MKKNVVFILYLILAVIATFPLVLNLRSSLIGWPLDAFLYLWNIDTFWEQILSAQNPFWTNRIFFPPGTNLVFHSYAPLISILGLPFLKNLVLYLNTLIIISLALSAFFAYILAMEFTKNNKASVVAGFTYGFCPILISFLISQHYYFAFASPLIPLSILSLTYFLKNGGWKYLFFLIAMFWISFFIDYYTTVLICIMAVIYFLSFSILNFKKTLFTVKENLTKYSLVIIFAFAIPLGLEINFIKTLPEYNNYSREKSYYPQLCSASIKNVLKPNAFNPFLGNRAEQNKRVDTPSIFLGWSILVFAVIALVKFPKKLFPISFSGVFVFLYSLGTNGPLLDVFSKIPFLGLVDCPQRFLIGTNLSLSVLLAVFVSLFKRSKFYKLVFLLSLTLVFFEYASFNLPLSKVDIPNLYQVLASKNSSKTILELPSGISESKSSFGYDWSIEGLLSKQMYWQTLHNKPRIGGYISRLNKNLLEEYKNEPILSDLFSMASLNGKWNERIYPKNEVEKFIKKYNLGYIIFSPNKRQLEFTDAVDRIFGTRIIEKQNFDGYILYTLN